VKISIEILRVSQKAEVRLSIPLLSLLIS